MPKFESAPIDTSESLETLIGLSGFADQKVEAISERSKGIFEKRVQNELIDLHREHRHFFEKPTANEFFQMVGEMELRDIPELVYKAVEERRRPFREAYIENEAIGFVVRTRILNKVIEDWEEESSRTGQSEIPTEIQKMIMVHLMLTHADMANANPLLQNLRELSEEQRQEFFNLSVGILGNLVDMGVQNPVMFEKVYRGVADLADKRAQLYYGTTYYSESERDTKDRRKFVWEQADNIYSDKAGMRAEIVANLMMNSILQDSEFLESLTGAGINITDLGIRRANVDMDRDGIMDWGVVGTIQTSEGPVEELLVAIDVKTESEEKMRRQKNTTSGIWGGEQATISIDSKYGRRRPDGSFEVVTEDSKETTKTLESRSDSFIEETGVSIVGVRIPFTSDMDETTGHYANKAIELSSFADMRTIRNNVRISQEILAYALQQAIKRTYANRVSLESEND